MTVIILATHCIACQHTLTIGSEWCSHCESDEYVVNDVEIKDRSK